MEAEVLTDKLRKLCLGRPHVKLAAIADWFHYAYPLEPLDEFLAERNAFLNGVLAEEGEGTAHVIMVGWDDEEEQDIALGYDEEASWLCLIFVENTPEEVIAKIESIPKSEG